MNFQRCCSEKLVYVSLVPLVSESSSRTNSKNMQFLFVFSQSPNSRPTHFSSAIMAITSKPDSDSIISSHPTSSTEQSNSSFYEKQIKSILEKPSNSRHAPKKSSSHRAEMNREKFLVDLLLKMCYDFAPSLIFTVLLGRPLIITACNIFVSTWVRMLSVCMDFKPNN